MFAHEYQHLLETYEDPNECNWVDEGIADWARTYTGYFDPAAPVTDIHFDNHVQCFLGWAGDSHRPTRTPGGRSGELPEPVG